MRNTLIEPMIHHQICERRMSHQEQVFLFASAQSREGTTFSALQTAAEMATYCLDLNVLVVDMNMKHPEISARIGLRRPGWSNLLQPDAGQFLRAVCLPVDGEHPNIWIMPIGNIVDVGTGVKVYNSRGNPLCKALDSKRKESIVQWSPLEIQDQAIEEHKTTELTRTTPIYTPGSLAGNLPHLIKALKQEFDLILIDGGAVMNSPYLLFAAQHVDSVVMVVQAGKSRRQVVQLASEQLSKSGANVIGAIMNRRKFYIPKMIYRRFF